MILEQQLEDILDSSRYLLSDIKPSEWAEQNRTMTSEVSPFPGRFSFRHTPYLKELVDCLSPNHPARIVAVKKGAQLGMSTSVLENGIGWIISQNPGNILFLTGHIDLSEEAMNGKIDQMIDSCGLRPLIRPNIIRKKNQRTGDTSKSKEFPGGSLIAGGAGNHKLLRQRSVRYGFIDDFDAAKKSSTQSGNTRTLIQQRFAAYYDKMKLYYISTPELKQTSNIEPVYLLGDQRKYFVPCPCCGDYINLEWSIDIEETEGREKGGITWKLDESGKLVPGSVGYICQKCSGFFDDSKKLEMNLVGEWRPTAEPSEIGYYSYHISSLYAPPGMYDWEYYVRQYLEACPPGQKPKEDLYKTFVNLCLGEAYEQVNQENEANVLQRNIRDYPIGTIPEALSMKDGNGRIVMLTCACDLNGIVEDARLDYEIVAWAESGACYSVQHGSIGTFIPRENSLKIKTDREKWSYEAYHQRSVWGKLDEILITPFSTDTATPRKMRIAISGVDTGHYTTYAYHFLDNTKAKAYAGRFSVVGLKGDKESKFRKFDADTSSFKFGKERPDLFLLDVNYLKDILSNHMQLKWHPQDPKQPVGFMNYPTPSFGLYGFTNFFEHYEAEHRVPETKDGEITGFRWVKKDSSVQNHFWDCFDSLTEVLTDNGWRFFADLKNTSSLATVNLITNELEFHKPTCLIKKPHNDKMILIDGKRINVCVTPNHRMVVYRKKFNKNSNSGRMLNSPEIVLAKDLRVTDTIKITCDWNSEGDEYYIIPQLKNRFGNVISEEKRIESELWASFIGLYVAEGSTSKSFYNGSWRHRVSIHQNLGTKFNEIKELLDKLPFKYNIYKSKGNCHVFTIAQKQLYIEVDKLGRGCYNKESGQWIKNQSSQVISRFLYFAILGDGNIDKNGHRKYYTTSKKLADDIQELFIKTGKQANIYEIWQPPCKLNNSQNSKKQYHISENNSQKASIRKADNTPIFKEIDYDGFVYCASVTNETLVLRRNGKSFIAGNCRTYNMALKDIIVENVLKEWKIKGTWMDFCKIWLPK